MNVPIDLKYYISEDKKEIQLAIFGRVIHSTMQKQITLYHS